MLTMATLTGEDPTSSQGSDEEEDAVWEKLYYSTPEGRHVDALIDISEKEALKDLEPHEYHCYCGWEEAVQDWARAAPLSCLFLPHKEKASSPALHDAGSSASTAEHHCECHTGSSNCLKGKKAALLNQQTGCWRDAAVAALHVGTSEWTLFGGMQKIPYHFLLEEEVEKEKTDSQPHQLCSKHVMSDSRPTKPQKHGHRPSSRLVPIKNFTFLPPVELAHLNRSLRGQLFNGKKPSHEEVLHEIGFMFDKRSDGRGARGGPDANTPTDSAALVSKYQTCQHNLNLFSAISIPLPKRIQVPLSFNPNTVHCSGYLVGKSRTPALVPVPAHAVKLYKTCGINV